MDIAGFLQKPGSYNGPCEPQCLHDDCQYTRTLAAVACRFCAKPIGFETKFYKLKDELAHATCVEGGRS